MMYRELFHEARSEVQKALKAKALKRLVKLYSLQSYFISSGCLEQAAKITDVIDDLSDLDINNEWKEETLEKLAKELLRGKNNVRDTIFQDPQPNKI